MPIELQTVVILLWVCVGLLLLLLLLSLVILRRLGRLGRRSSSVQAQQEKIEVEEVPAVETSPGGAFEAFLEEDPARRQLPKGEQFKAYRKWRQAKGLNWSNS